MVAPVFAMPPPEVFVVLRVGVVLAITAIGIFVRLTANSTGAAQGERDSACSPSSVAR